ncbi:YjzD family protein [Halobacillus yeomjeoni]|uniref:YjzD family protein n=1 Tax=Halobacillus yeomjeoni TaxID=311194 RepID=A0A931MTL5_9BACI|nr:YjzD family protein [Halobacillus yeomjeoni]MBH0228777.1 YjzD family protein [Halobacillus yeomjeoni]MCA0983820.1 YjzD family protein [Halobacillus yeomjeoni]
MRIIWTLIWAFLLSSMTAYVISNMAGGSFHLSQVIIMTILFTVVAAVLGEGIIKEEEA